MKESTRRKLDRIYQPRHRRILDEIYRGDPSDPDNVGRIWHAEMLGSTTSQPSWRARLSRWWYWG